MTKQPVNANKTWTPSQDTKFRSLVNGNTPTRVIAIKMERSSEAIQSHASKLNVSLKPTNQSPYNRKKS